MLSIREKLRHILGNEVGQSLVETALLMCFVAAVVLAVNWDSFRESAGGAYLKMASSVGSRTERYKTMSNSELKKIANAQRVALDVAALETAGRKFLGMSMNELKEIFNTKDESLLNGNTKYEVDGKNISRGVILFDYHIVNTGDDGNNVNIYLRSNGAGSAKNEEVMQWMQGIYDTNTSNYNRNPENISYRVLFSDAVIEKSPFPNATGDQSATVRVYFTFNSEKKVETVTINTTRSYSLGNNNWKRTLCNDLSGLVVRN